MFEKLLSVHRGGSTHGLSWALPHLEGPLRGVLHVNYLLSTRGSAAVRIRTLVRYGLLPSVSQTFCRQTSQQWVVLLICVPHGDTNLALQQH